MEKLTNWLKYFFGSFFSHERSRECEWRSVANVALSMLLSFLILLLGLNSGHIVAFGFLYDSADAFKDFAYSSFNEIDAEIADGKMYSDRLINTYDNDDDAIYSKNGYDLIVDFRDTREIYDDFTVICSSEDRPEISYEIYLGEPAHIQRDYTDFRAQYSGRILDVGAKYEEYHAYLVSVTDEGSASYEEAVAEAFAKLEAEMPDDYYEQIYLLYVDTYYPELSLSEYGATAPTLHGYYYNKVASDTDGKFIALFKDTCYISLESVGGISLFVGDYSTLADTALEGEKAVDEFIKAAFETSYGVDFLMYGINLFGIYAVVILLWIIFMVIYRFISKRLNIQVTDRFGPAGLMVGSYLWFSAVIAALVAFVTSFFASQGAVFYLTAVVFILAFVIRSIVFISKEAINAKDNPPEEHF